MCNAPAPGSGSGVYAIGGVDTSSSQNGDPVSTDPVHDEWVPKQQMQTGQWGWQPRRHPTGLSTPSAAWQPTPVFLNSVEVFDIAANSWTPGPQSLPVATAWHAAAVGPNGLIYVPPWASTC